MSDRLNQTCIVCKARYHNCGSCGWDPDAELNACSSECASKVREAAKARIIDKYNLTEQQMEELGDLLKTAGY